MHLFILQELSSVHLFICSFSWCRGLAMVRDCHSLVHGHLLFVILSTTKSVKASKKFKKLLPHFSSSQLFPEIVSGMANSVAPDQTASSECQIWVCTVYLCYFIENFGV